MWERYLNFKTSRSELCNEVDLIIISVVAVQPQGANPRRVVELCHWKHPINGCLRSALYSGCYPETFCTPVGVHLQVKQQITALVFGNIFSISCRMRSHFLMRENNINICKCNLKTITLLVVSLLYFLPKLNFKFLKSYRNMFRILKY